MKHKLEDVTWRTKDGELLKLGSMETRHLQHALDMIKRRGDWRTGYCERIELILRIRRFLVSKAWGSK